MWISRYRIREGCKSCWFSRQASFKPSFHQFDHVSSSKRRICEPATDRSRNNELKIWRKVAIGSGVDVRFIVRFEESQIRGEERSSVTISSVNERITGKTNGANQTLAPIDAESAVTNKKCFDMTFTMRERRLSRLNSIQKSRNFHDDAWCSASWWTIPLLVVVWFQDKTLKQQLMAETLSRSLLSPLLTHLPLLKIISGTHWNGRWSIHDKAGEFWNART